MAGRLTPADDDWWTWADEAVGGPRVDVRLGTADDGRLHVHALHVEGPVTAELLRSIPIGRIEALANALLHPQAADLGWRRDARLPRRLRHASGHRRPDEFYVAVAAAYRHLVAVSSQPVADLADANEVPRTTAARWVKEARRRGLLAPGRAGKAG